MRDFSIFSENNSKSQNMGFFFGNPLYNTHHLFSPHKGSITSYKNRFRIKQILPLLWGNHPLLSSSSSEPTKSLTMTAPAFIPSISLGSQTCLFSGSKVGRRRRALINTQPVRTVPRAVQEIPPDATPPVDVSANEPLRTDMEAFDPGSVVIAPSFALAGTCLFIGGALCYAGNGFLVLGLPVTALGILLAVQTLRVRFVFSATRFSVAKRSPNGLQIIRGWEHPNITNWEVWWKSLPILAYFKESESYNGRGSIHFFPIVCNARQLIYQLRQHTSHLEKSNYD